jgi:PilZ domain
MESQVNEITLNTPTLVELTKEDERRVDRRKIVRLNADVRLPDSKSLESHTIDLSRRGIGLLTSVKLEHGQDCKLLIDLSVCGTPMALRLIGRVCYCAPSGDNFRVGLQFVQMDDDTARLLTDLLK